MDVAGWRRETRARLVEERLQIPADEHRVASQKIEAALEEVLNGMPPQILSVYWPYRGEVDLRALMDRLRHRGWTTALPSVVARRTPLEFFRWAADSEMHETGAYGIPVPASKELVKPSVVITPLVAFDAKNYRLGYGAGYFDVTLGNLDPRPLAIGVGFEMNRVDTIYPMETDIPMDIVVTEEGVQYRPEKE
jgi:5-formyltetrahydrofolate cyclo-ligase